MFNKIWDQSNLPEKKETFQTEKEVILCAIEKYDGAIDNYPTRYYDNWQELSEYGIKYIKKSYPLSSDIGLLDKEVFGQLASKCSDEDIIRALFESDILEDCYYDGVHFIDNVNIPDDIIARRYEVGDPNSHRAKVREEYLRKMQKTEYKYITEETKAKIDAAVAEYDAEIRKRKEDETKQKLTAFLTTAAATKSVLTGSSIDDVVEQTITSDVDDAVLDYMNQLFNK
jgi:hypothetical protein